MINYEQLEQIQKKLQKNITAKRYRHTIGVQYTCISLAMRYGVDLDQAALAGLLHDCAKCLDDKEMLRQCEKNNIVCNKTEKKQPYLLHAKLGAWLCRQKVRHNRSGGCRSDPVSHNRAPRYDAVGKDRVYRRLY